MKIPLFARLALVILISVALSEVAPEAVNAFLILILVGVVLGHWKAFQVLASTLSSLKG